jgi:hypothetical protein
MIKNGKMGVLLLEGLWIKVISDPAGRIKNAGLTGKNKTTNAKVLPWQN